MEDSLILASESGNVVEISQLLRIDKVDPNFSNKYNGGGLRSALHRASAYGHIEAVELLLEVSFDY